MVSQGQLADALQLEAHALDTTCTTPAATEPFSSSAHSSERPATAVHVTPKRKRAFSKRTKTGCMTCRRRRKKCDEQHPTCNNCLRRGFLCDGYTSQSTAQRPFTPKAPVPWQSKEGYAKTNGQFLQEKNHDRQLTEHVNSQTMWPVVVGNERVSPHNNNTNPTECNSAYPSWPPKRSWPSTSQDRHIRRNTWASPIIERSHSIHELSRKSPKPDYPLLPPIHDIPHGPPPKAGMPLLSQGALSPRARTNTTSTTLDTNSPQVQARTTLSIENQSFSRTSGNDNTEMDKMVRGEFYRPFDVQLMEERDRCRRALAQSNNACNTLGGLDSKEQDRLLKEILGPQLTCMLNPPGPPGLSTSMMCRSAPSIGPRTVVEAPFTCHYGHLDIGEDVMISHDCVFIDDCYIFVGARTWVGPKVTILTTMADLSMQESKGTRRRYKGRRVRIMQDCYIGAGCTIYPAVTLGRGAYIAPGEIVQSDIAPYGFQGFTPNYM